LTKRRSGKLWFKVGYPRLAIKEYFGVGYYVTFHWPNCDCKKGQVWDLTKKYRGMALPL
jgi:hypothetical protein